MLGLFTANVGGWRERLLGTRGRAIRSIAVLPLENLSRDPEQEYFADDMTDALTTDLSKIGALRVISRTSAMHYKGTNKTLPEIARELNVDGVVEGSVMRSGNRVRISADFIYAHTDQHLWAETYERDLGDILRLQSEVAQTIAQQLRVQLTPHTAGPPQRGSHSQSRGLRCRFARPFLRGRCATTLQRIEKAKKYFEEAIQKDPSFALGYVGLADRYKSLKEFRLLPPQADAYQPAKEAIRKALELNSNARK